MNLILQHQLHKLENKLWCELVKTHFGFGFMSLSILQHLQNFVPTNVLKKMFVEMKLSGLSQLPWLFLRQLTIEDLERILVLWATPFVSQGIWVLCVIWCTLPTHFRMVRCLKLNLSHLKIIFSYFSSILYYLSWNTVLN